MIELKIFGELIKGDVYCTSLYHYFEVVDVCGDDYYVKQIDGDSTWTHKSSVMFGKDCYLLPLYRSPLYLAMSEADAPNEMSEDE